MFIKINILQLNLRNLNLTIMFSIQLNELSFWTTKMIFILLTNLEKLNETLSSIWTGFIKKFLNVI